MTYENEDGHALCAEHYAHTQGTDDEWTLLSRELFEYDLRRRKIKTTHANGRSRSTQWMCCGALRETDEDGITLSHAYNDYKQKIETIRSLTPTMPETITYREYDAASRMTKKLILGKKEVGLLNLIQTL